MGAHPYTLLLRYSGHRSQGGEGGGEGGGGGESGGGGEGHGEGGEAGEGGGVVGGGGHWAAAVVVPPGALVEVSWSGHLARDGDHILLCAGVPKP
jgi:hypothetical protein